MAPGSNCQVRLTFSANGKANGIYEDTLVFAGQSLTLKAEVGGSVNPPPPVNNALSFLMFGAIDGPSGLGYIYKYNFIANTVDTMSVGVFDGYTGFVSVGNSIYVGATELNNYGIYKYNSTTQNFNLVLSNYVLNNYTGSKHSLNVMGDVGGK